MDDAAQVASQLLQGSFDNVTPELDIGPGDRVRSYDFAGVRDCYVEGVVESVTEPMEGCARYKLRVERCVRGGVEVTAHAEHVFPPVNGTPSWTGKLTNFVERLPPTATLQ